MGKILLRMYVDVLKAFYMLGLNHNILLSKVAHFSIPDEVNRDLITL